MERVVENMGLSEEELVRRLFAEAYALVEHPEDSDDLGALVEEACERWAPVAFKRHAWADIADTSSIAIRLPPCRQRSGATRRPLVGPRASP